MSGLSLAQNLLGGNASRATCIGIGVRKDLGSADAFITDEKAIVS